MTELNAGSAPATIYHRASTAGSQREGLKRGRLKEVEEGEEGNAGA